MKKDAATTSTPAQGGGGVNSLYKWGSLGILTVQNCSQMLLMRYSRTTGPPYIASTAVAVTELFKLLVCIIVIGNENKWDSSKLRAIVVDQILSIETLYVGVPAFVYTIQNNLLYIATTHLDAATTQVTYQLKILCTALFSVAMLDTKLTPIKWGSLVMLFIGVVLVQMPTASAPFTVNVGQNPMVGLFAVSVACILSGFAGVYFEKILKTSKVSLWIRNFQLGSLGTAIAVMYSFYQDGDVIMENGFFHNYTIWTWLVIIEVAFGGLLVAIVVKYADNILKGFATSISVVMSTIFSIFFFDFVLSISFTVGAALVLLATYLFSANFGSRPKVE